MEKSLGTVMKGKNDHSRAQNKPKLNQSPINTISQRNLASSLDKCSHTKIELLAFACTWTLHEKIKLRNLSNEATEPFPSPPFGKRMSSLRILSANWIFSKLYEWSAEREGIIFNCNLNFLITIHLLSFHSHFELLGFWKTSLLAN